MRRLAYEASDNGLLSPDLAASIRRVKGAKKLGVRLGNWLTCFLASIPTVVRDRRFFVKHWGFGLLGIRRRFPFQFFPARQVEWLNPLGWCFMGMFLLHFFWFVIHSANAQATQQDTSADLRYVSLMATFGGVLSALSRAYPPTEKPQVEGRLRIDTDVSSF